MDENHFSVVIRLYSPTKGLADNEDDSNICKIAPGDQKGRLQLPPQQLHPSPNDVLTFNEIYSCSKSQERDFHRNSLFELVNSVLEGFNGTVISISDNPSTVEAAPNMHLVVRAARHIFSTLKKLKKAGLSANLIVPCTFVMLKDELAYDLLHELPSSTTTAQTEIESKPILELGAGNQLVNVVTSEAKGLADVKKMISHGEVKMKEYLSSQDTSKLCHTIFTIGVKFADFGTLFAPISGTLSFVSLNYSPSSFDVHEILTSKCDVSPSNKAINDFILAIHKLSGKTLAFSDSPDSSQSSLKIPTSDQSILTTLLEEALGGNCKTLLVCHVPTVIKSSEYHLYHSLLELLSQAKNIENKPDKTELAKKALMDAYMKELRKLYGGDSSGCGKGDEEDETLNEITSENKDAELAAKALASAVKNDKENPNSESEESDDEESSLQKSGHNIEESTTNNPVKTRRFTLTKKTHVTGNLESSSSSSFYQSSVDLTIESLVGIIQDPDKGVPRARTGELHHVKIHRGKGDIFSGADIVTWLVKNVAGVENDDDAEQIGQILLDKEAIFHSEGSSVFANSAYLFYYARESRPMGKTLTQEEIQALLSHDKEPPQVQVMKVTDVPQQKPMEKIPHNLEQSFSLEATLVPMTMNVNSAEKKESDELDVTLTANTLSHSNSLNKSNKAQDHRSTSPESESAKNEDSLPQSSVESTLVASSMREGSSTTKEDTTAIEYQSIEESNIGPEQSQEEKQDDNEENDEEDETEQTPLLERDPNLKAIATVPDLQTLETYSDYPHPLHYQAATSNEAGVIKHLIHWYGVDQFDERERTPLMFAALGNKAGSCRALLEHGSVPDRRDKSGLTAVHIACYHGHKEALTALVNKGANIAIRDKMLHTAFHWSVVPASSNCLRILLRHSQKHTLEKEADKSGLTPVHWAIYYDHLEHMKLLIQRCTDMIRKDACGRTFAIYSIQKERLQCFEHLLKVCPELAVTSDSHDLTPLHHASTNSCTKFLTAIINTMKATSNYQQINLELLDQYGRTPVHYAVLYGQSEILKILLSHGAHNCPCDKDGRTPLDLAKKYGVKHNEEIEQLLESGSSEQTRASISSNITDVSGGKPEQSAVCNLL